MIIDTPSSPRVALVTGANCGIGRVTARELARQGMQVFVACRSAARAQPVLDEIAALPGALAAEFLPLDLGDMDSVRSCVRAFLAHRRPLHLLVNNAGVAGLKGLTRSGFEMSFGVNHMGHFLLTQLLIDTLKDSAPARVVTVASKMHHQATGLPWDGLRQPTRSWTGVPEYRVSKLANVLFSAELGRRLTGSGVDTHALHPGIVATEIWRQVPAALHPLLRRLFGMLTPEEGARTTLHCATAPELTGRSGGYHVGCREVPPSALAQDAALARELWDRSEAWLGSA